MRNQELNSLYHSTYSLKFHLVLVTKYRRKVITKDMLTRLEELFNDQLNRWECDLIEFNGEAEQVHLLISTHPKILPYKLVNSLKTVTSRLIRKEFPEHGGIFYSKPVFWSRSYRIISVGGAPLSGLKAYIQNQAQI